MFAHLKNPLGKFSGDKDTTYFDSQDKNPQKIFSQGLQNILWQNLFMVSRILSNFAHVSPKEKLQYF